MGHATQPKLSNLRVDAGARDQRANAAMDRYADGDNEAFAEIYEALSPRLYRFALAKARDAAKAEDLVQQTLLLLHRSRCQFVKGSPVVPWAVAILNRLFIDQVRRKRVEVFTRTGVHDTVHPSDYPDPESLACNRQLERIVQQQVSLLTSPQKLAFQHVFYEQMSHAAAAQLLGTTVAGVKLRIQRATRAIRLATGG